MHKVTHRASCCLTSVLEPGCSLGCGGGGSGIGRFSSSHVLYGVHQVKLSGVEKRGPSTVKGLLKQLPAE
jgi:hypothetical protein